MSSKNKTWRAILTSVETPYTEKIRVVSDILKKVGTKIVKNERLIPLLEKKMEMKQALVKFETSQYLTLIEYLFQFSTNHVVTTRESGTCLFDCPDLRINCGSTRREKIDQCLNQMQTVIGLCFAKIMSIAMNDTLTTIGAQTPNSEIEKVGDHIQILADLYLFLIDEAPQVIRKDFVECMTFCARDALENIANISKHNDSYNQHILNLTS